MLYINFNQKNLYLWLQKVCRYMELRMSKVEIFVIVKKRWKG